MNKNVGGKISNIRTRGSHGLSLLKGLSWFHTTDSWISRSFLFFPTHSRHALSFSYWRKLREPSHQAPGSFHIFWIDTTGNRCPQSSVFIRLMVQPLTSEAKAAALLQIGGYVLQILLHQPVSLTSGGVYKPLITMCRVGLLGDLSRTLLHVSF